jgi:signal peptide peptidase SppA
MNINCDQSKTCCFTKIYKKLFGKKNKVAHLLLSGVIGKESKFDSALNFANYQNLIKKAFTTKNIKAVAISINSPGGSPVQSELIYNYIRLLANKHKLPVYTFAQDVAASGGYWLLLSGDEIYAHQSSIVGSIGVIFSGFGFVDLISKIGIERRVHTSGESKAILDPFLPENPKHQEILKQAQNDIYQAFVSLVKDKRQNKLNETEQQLFSGAFWAGATAVKLGLIDEVATLQNKMHQKFGEEVEIIEITEKKSSFLKNLLTKQPNIAMLSNQLNEIIAFSRFGL